MLLVQCSRSFAAYLCMCWVMYSSTQLRWWVHRSLRQWPMLSSWLKAIWSSHCFAGNTTLLREGKKKQNKKRLKSPLLKRFISKCSRAMLALHIFSCSPKAAHVRYFLSFMLLTGMHHEVQICNLLSVLVIRHDFLCLLMRAAAKCSLL